MTENTKPEFSDILNLINELPEYPDFETQNTDTLSWLTDWLTHYSRVLDISKGFLVNRCALYWAGYDVADGFDGKGFVDSCQDTQGSLRQLAQILDTDLQIFELDPHNTNKPTLDEIALAASYGMMTVDESTQLYCGCSFGQGVEATAQKALNAIDHFTNLETFMTDYCGLDHAAMLGATIACLMKGIPVILEGTSGKLVKLLLEKTRPSHWNSIILTENIDLPINHHIPGHKMVMAAIMLKSIHVGNDKTDCGKIKTAA